MRQFIAPQQNFLNPQYGVNAFINGNNTFALNPQSAQQFHAFNLGSPVHQNLNQIAQVPQAQIPQKQILFPQNVTIILFLSWIIEIVHPFQSILEEKKKNTRRVLRY